MNKKHIDGFTDWTDEDYYSHLNSRFQHVVREHAGKTGHRPRRSYRDTDWSERRPVGTKPQPHRERGF